MYRDGIAIEGDCGGEGERERGMESLSERRRGGATAKKRKRESKRRGEEGRAGGGREVMLGRETEREEGGFRGVPH